MGSAPASPPGAGRLPEEYVGSWQAVRGSQTWRLTLAPGGIGEQVMSLAVQDPGFACAWTAALRSATDPVELDVSTVTSGAPPTCTAGSRSRLRLLPDGALRRELAGGGSPPLDYRRR
ncbi:hypothetical protein ACFCYM_20865 [Streptomyces sp. NPDC056254]|uniref:hypothetical protein n=1 Tax=Streptomyces sp. NPDC056254 TaxID=3345763 RepID=UPI0035E27C50